MLLSLHKVLRTRFSPSRSGDGASSAFGTKTKPASSPMPLVQIKQHMGQTLQDISGIDADRLRYSLRAARTAGDLWMLRSDIYQVISQQHSQTEAAQRINQLLHCFAQWLPARQLSPI
jgi:hypothetical protein